MAPKKSTEQSSTPVVSSTVHVTEKSKKTKKNEQSAPSSVETPVETPVVSTEGHSNVSSALQVPVTEKSKKTKKNEQSDVSQVKSESVVSELHEKPKKSSKKKTQEQNVTVAQASSNNSTVTEQQEQEQQVVTEHKKRTTKKKVKSEETEQLSTTESQNVSETTTEQSTTSETTAEPEKRVRKVVNQETLKADVEQLQQQVDVEIQRLRSDQQKNKGVKFLKAVNKSLKNLSSDLSRVLKSKTKTTRNKNTSSGFMKPVRISSEMALFTNWDPSLLYSRVDVTKFLCNYIKINSLQNPEDKRQILCDDKLASLLKVDVNGENPLTYPGLQQHIQQHFINQSSSVFEEEVKP
jgi:upstream activation factor subunit UAF30